MSRNLSCDADGADFTPTREPYWIEGRFTVHDKYDDGSPHDHEIHVDLCAAHSAGYLNREPPKPVREVRELNVRSAYPENVPRKRIVDEEEYQAYMKWLESQQDVRDYLSHDSALD